LKKRAAATARSGALFASGHDRDATGESMHRREFTFAGMYGLAALTPLFSRRLDAVARIAANGASQSDQKTRADFTADHGRPPLAQRAFVSETVENTIAATKARIPNPQLATLFENCYPNTLDTTVRFTERNGRPDTFIITGDIPAMWLRDSSAQVWPYLPLAKTDARLQSLFRGLIHRQAACILLDAYANAFYSTPRTGIFAHDLTEMRPGVHERKWEVDSLCYCMRLASGYWSMTGDTEPFDEQWHRAARRVVAVLREQQRLHGDGPYRFQRLTTSFYDNAPNDGLGNPSRKIGLIHSAFRPSDDACLLPFLVPSNLFAVVSLRQLHRLAVEVLRDNRLGDDAASLADEVDRELRSHAIVNHPNHGKIYAYEIDGMGNSLLMDDANVPSLLSLPYLGCCKADDPVYQQTRAFVLSDDNPFFFRGSVGEGIGGPHEGPEMIWPLSIIMRAMTSQDDREIEHCLRMLIKSSAGTGFLHESFNENDPHKFTRPWFAWCNSAFGELILNLAGTKPETLNNTA
jgi:hypothetical protein